MLYNVIAMIIAKRTYYLISQQQRRRVLLLGNSKCVRRRGKKVARPDEPDELVSSRLAGGRAIRLVRLIYIHKMDERGTLQSWVGPQARSVGSAASTTRRSKNYFVGVCVCIFFPLCLKSPRTGKKNENEVTCQHLHLTRPILFPSGSACFFPAGNMKSSLARKQHRHFHIYVFFQLRFLIQL